MSQACTHGAGAYAYACYSQLLQFGGGRRGWGGENVDRTVQVFGQTGDDGGIGNSGSEDTVSTSITIGGEPADRFVIAVFRSSYFFQIDIRSCIQYQRDACLGC